MGELIEDVLFDLGARRGIGAADQVAQDRDEGGVLGREAFQPGPGGVDQADAVVGEVGGLEDAGPSVGLKAGRYVRTVLLVTVAPGFVGRGW
jgi:hypothetical protein